MRRLCLTLVEFSPSGGLFHFALQLGEGLVGLGHDVELLTGRDPELLPRNPGLRLVAVLPTWHPHPAGLESRWRRKPRRVWRALCYLAAWGRTWRHLVRTKPDVVQFAEWRFPLDGVVVALLGRRLPRTVFAAVAHSPLPLVEQRNSGDLHKTGWALRHALAAAYAAMGVVFVLGRRSGAELLQAFPGVRRVVVIPHGDSGALLAVLPPPASAAPRRALLFGTIARYKGVDLLLDAWSIVRAQDPGAELVIAGAPVDVDVDALRARVTEVGGVELRLGYVPASAVTQLLGSVRVVVAPYRAANQSGVVHLAHTAGRPVVATDVGDLAAVIRHGETGLLVPPHDAAALAAALLLLLRDPAVADRLGRAGQDRLAAAASWRHVAAPVAAAYEELVSTPAARR